MDLGVMARKEEESWSRFITDGNVQDGTILISQGMEVGTLAWLFLGLLCSMTAT